MPYFHWNYDSTSGPWELNIRTSTKISINTKRIYLLRGGVGGRYGQCCMLGTVLQWCGSTIMYYSGLKLTLWGPNHSWKNRPIPCLLVRWLLVSSAVMMLNTRRGCSFLFFVFLFIAREFIKKNACRWLAWILCINSYFNKIFNTLKGYLP